MVLPLYDENEDRRTFPYVNYALIAINVLVFAFLQNFGTDDWFTMAFSTIPEEIVTGKDLVGDVEVTDERGRVVDVIHHQKNPISVYITLLTSMFMHGSWMHLLGNMLFLWIFGDNVEDYLGHGRYIIFYLLCGVLASLSHVAVTYAFGSELAREIPSLGASGAISGVLGAYLLLFPHKQVVVLLFRILTAVPAYVAIGIWFLFQIVYSLLSLRNGGDGVAYGAHIGGFIAGLVLVKPFATGIDHVPPSLRRWPRRDQPY